MKGFKMNALTAAELLREIYRYDGPPKFPHRGYYPCEVESDETDTQYIFEYKEDEELLYIGFPGTASVRDVITDIRAYKTKVVPFGNKGSRIRVHFGFNRAEKSIRGDILMLVRKFHPANIIIFGHSLGAALATLCAIDIQYNTGIAPRVYLSGSPRVGNRAFRNSYNRRVPDTIRCENFCDPVPHMSCINYYHIGKRDAINAHDKSVRVKFTSGVSFFLSLFLYRHHIKNYIKGYGAKLKVE